MFRSSIPNRRLYRRLRTSVYWYFSTLYDFTQSGVEHIPKSGPLILASNHSSFYDPPVMSPIPREINYFARDTLFQGFFGKVITELGSIPVARENLEAKSLKAVFKVLKAGGTIAIYPEGTRSPKGDLMEPKAGVGMIALKSKSIVVPSRIFGAYEAFNCSDRIPKIGGRIHITYGLPVSVQELDPGKDHPNRYLEASTRIMSKIASLNLPEQTVI